MFRPSRMIRLLPVWAVPVLAAVAGGCAGPGGPTNATFYDPVGGTVATGRLDLPRLDVAGPTFQGQWTLVTVSDDQLRPAFATGPYQGRRKGDEFVITLNPGRTDDTISLNGRVVGGSAGGGESLSGWWGHNTFVGLEQSGTFDAKRR